MISEKGLLAFSEVLRDVPIEDIADLFGRASTKHILAGTNYINIGETTRQLAFIEKGLIRTYAIKENGEEATLLLRWEEQFIASHDTVILNQPSRFIYQAVEHTTVLEIDYAEVEKMMQEDPRFEPLRNFVLMTMLGGALQLVEDFVLLNAEQRYMKLIAEKFDIVNRVPDKHIASMLGITAVSLSRIRKRIASRH